MNIIRRAYLSFIYRTGIYKKFIEGHDKVRVINHGSHKGKLLQFICGKNNSIELGRGVKFNKTKIRIVGNNNTIVFGDLCNIGPNCSFWMEGNNIKIVIGNHCSFTHTCHFCAQEDNTKILVGEDCLFSNTIIVRTSDSHPIYDIKNNKRINNAKDVIIGNHVWIAPNSKIFKGATINNGAIIGSNTLVTNEIPNNSLAVGMPAKVIKTGVTWTHEKLF